MKLRRITLDRITLVDRYLDRHDKPFRARDLADWLTKQTGVPVSTGQASRALQAHRYSQAATNYSPRHVVARRSFGRGARWYRMVPTDAKIVTAQSFSEQTARFRRDVLTRINPAARQDPQVAAAIDATLSIVDANLDALAKVISQA